MSPCFRSALVLSLASPALGAKCCWSKWGDESTCGGYSGSGGVCNSDSSKSCSSDGDCPEQPSPQPSPSPAPTPPEPAPPSGELNIDGLTKWIGSGEGPCIPQGNLLMKDSLGATVAKVAFKNEPDWFVAPIWLGNAFGIAEDLSGTDAFTIVYDAEADFWIQMRSKSHWNGGAQWATRLAAGQNVSRTVTWESAESWETPLGTPAQSLDEVLLETQGMIMVGNKNNALTVYRLSIPGFAPPGRSFLV